MFVLDRLEKGDAIEDIVNSLGGDEQLVKMWMSFLIHNRWIEHPDGRWNATKKGKEWISRYDNKSDR